MALPRDSRVVAGTRDITEPSSKLERTTARSPGRHGDVTDDSSSPFSTRTIDSSSRCGSSS